MPPGIQAATSLGPASKIQHENVTSRIMRIMQISFLVPGSFPVFIIVVWLVFVSLIELWCFSGQVPEC